MKVWRRRLRVRHWTNVCINTKTHSTQRTEGKTYKEIRPWFSSGDFNSFADIKTPGQCSASVRSMNTKTKTKTQDTHNLQKVSPWLETVTGLTA